MLVDMHCASNIVAFSLYKVHLFETLFFSFIWSSIKHYIIMHVLQSCRDLKFHKYFYMQRYMADIGKAWPVLIVCGGILPLFLSVIWLLMIRHFVAAMPWVTVVLFDVLIISGTMFFYLKG